MFYYIFCLCPVYHAIQTVMYYWPLLILHSCCNLRWVFKHQHQLGTGIMLYSPRYVFLSYAPSHRSSCVWLCWGSMVIVITRYNSNTDTVLSVCSVPFMVSYITSFPLPMDQALLFVSLLEKYLQEGICSLADWSSKSKLIYLHTFCSHKGHWGTALCRNHIPLPREQLCIKSRSKEASERLSQKDLRNCTHFTKKTDALCSYIDMYEMFLMITIQIAWPGSSTCTDK